MPVFEQLLCLDELKSANMVAGLQGRRKTIKWFHIAYGTSISTWIGEGCVVIITGVGLKYVEQDLLDIIQQVDAVHGAGIIIETGKYINMISKKVKNCADNLVIPIIESSKKLDLEKLTYSIGKLCFEDQIKKSVAELLKEIIYLPCSERIKRQIIEAGYSEETEYVAVTIRLLTKQKEKLFQITQKFNYRIQNELGRDNQHILQSYENGMYTYIMPYWLRNKKKTIHEVMNEIMVQITGQQKEAIMNIGIGDSITAIEDIGRSCYQAYYAIEMLGICKRINEVRSYADMGVYRIFFQYKNDQALNDMYYCILGELEEQDKINNSDLVETLECYLACNCNLSKTADQLFVHRNTMKYRIKKIKEILVVDFSDPNACFTLRFAFKIKKYLSEIYHESEKRMSS